MNAYEQMRAALELVNEIYDLLSKPCIVIEEVRQTCQKARAVLISMPQRNCDMGTAEEQAERFRNFCRNHQFVSGDSEDDSTPMYVCSNESCPLHDYYIAHGEDNCELAWAQMPYAEEGGAK